MSTAALGETACAACVTELKSKQLLSLPVGVLGAAHLPQLHPHASFADGLRRALPARSAVPVPLSLRTVGSPAYSGHSSELPEVVPDLPEVSRRLRLRAGLRTPRPPPSPCRRWYRAPSSAPTPATARSTTMARNRCTSTTACAGRWCWCWVSGAAGGGRGRWPGPGEVRGAVPLSWWSPARRLPAGEAAHAAAGPRPGDRRRQARAQVLQRRGGGDRLPAQVGAERPGTGGPAGVLGVAVTSPVSPAGPKA